MSTTIHTVDPLRDSRWPKFLLRHPRASVFHTSAWLEALRRTYGYEPVVFTTATSGDEIRNGLVSCQIQNWLTGRRMVSLPFSDHCEPLLKNAEELAALLSRVESQCRVGKWKYFEFRPLLLKESDGGQEYLAKSGEFSFHKLDLRPELNQLFSNFHKSCIQRNIQKAERERLTNEEGRSEALVVKFYRLLLLTRRRHKLPPQPLRWFRNLVECFGEDLTIRVASKGGQPIASILTLSYKKSLVYKYGCSDEKFHNLGGMPLLFWRAIQDAKKVGAREFDLGRSDLSNSSLATFKEHLGAERSKLCYFRLGQHVPARSNTDWKMRLVHSAFAHMPTPLTRFASNILYRYVG